MLEYVNESSPDWVRPVLVFDMGAQTAQLIARRVREAHVYSEIVSPKLSAEQILARKPLALIVSGGPHSVYKDGSPHIDPQLLESGVPILGICYGFQMLTQMLGGEVASAGRHEYGKAEVKVAADCPYSLIPPLNKWYGCLTMMRPKCCRQGQKWWPVRLVPK